MNARKGDHEERAEDAPKWVSVPRETGEPKGGKGYSGSIKRVDKVKSEKIAIRRACLELKTQNFNNQSQFKNLILNS